MLAIDINTASGTNSDCATLLTGKVASAKYITK